MEGDSVTERILETLIENTASAMASSFYLLAAVIESGYGASQKQIERKAEEIQNRSLNKTQRDSFHKKRASFYSLLYKLRREGFIDKKDGVWKITSSGRAKYKIIKNHLPKRQHKKETDTTFKIIVFDIPEKYRRKRYWLRAQLAQLGFKMLQRSVWVGKAKLPQEFMEDLRDLRIIQYIEILAVTKSGTLHSLD